MSSPAAPTALEVDSHKIVVVGGGLAGLAAAIDAYEVAQAQGVSAEIVLLEKMPRLGGNSQKASSGMNALNRDGGDTPELFKHDTMQSGGGYSDEALVQQLVDLSPDALQFLIDKGLDLGKVTQLGGHSQKRTWSPPAGPNVGFQVMSALIKYVKGLPGVVVMESTKLSRVHLNARGAVSGVSIEHVDAASPESAIAAELAAGAVILATGGFGANKELLAKHSPQAAALATTNGPWAQGEGLQIAAEVGASLMHLEHVQIHPTGFVDPSNPDAGTKFLAPEKLRGTGALLLNHAGQRFVNELSTRDVVSTALLAQPDQRAFLVLGPASSDDFGVAALGFYASKGLAVHCESLEKLAEHMRVEAEVLRAELSAYNEAASGATADRFVKTVFPHAVPDSGPFYVAIVTPVVHYTMGGVAVDASARALGAHGQPIPGLFAAGEIERGRYAVAGQRQRRSQRACCLCGGLEDEAHMVAGGVHGANRLGGNSLLECAVYGRIAGRAAVEYIAKQH
ncbi:hypothetical protein FOA52_009320 [Chlamydomonas sp. UWO 241]|nr:hypothetical protein FOA52_009320 [Chlamydomonas sp. UWO 241]